MKRSINLSAWILVIVLNIVGLLKTDESWGSAQLENQNISESNKSKKQIKTNTSLSSGNGSIDYRGPDSGVTIDGLQADANVGVHNASSAEAQDDAFDTVEEQTQRHVDQAKRLFVSKNYEASIIELEEAYRLIAKPIFLFNIGQSYRRLGTKRKALDYYRRFVMLDPNNRHANEANTAINELSAFLKQQELMDKEKRRPVWRRGWFWAVLGTALGSAAIATGLVVGLRVNEGTQDPRGPVILTFN